jgi:uncharacterized protein
MLKSFSFVLKKAQMPNKRKIFNDPVYGFVSIPSDIIFDLIEHPYFQRLRRIKQLGMAEYVYPGALHTRFHHALGAMHLMGQALQTLQSKGHLIFESEWEAAQIAILLHDIGHGPFSHVLEHTLLEKVHHEEISQLFMQKLNVAFEGRLEMAIQMFNGTYPRAFFHQLISSQLDMDRMDYLNRDCFFTGVAEGTIGVDRIIKMLNVFDNQLVVEEKGLLSVENFLNARRLMYWQVYLHKTSICAEVMLIQIIKRAKELHRNQSEIFATPAFKVFLMNDISMEDFIEDESVLETFANLDDTDIWGCIKVWASHPDAVLATLCRNVLDRKLFKIRFSNEPFSEDAIAEIKSEMDLSNFNDSEKRYFLVQSVVSNKGYGADNEQINILKKGNVVVDISEASDLPTIKALSNIVKKYYVCWAKKSE